MQKIFSVISLVLFACSALAQSKLETPTEQVQAEKLDQLPPVVVVEKYPTQFDLVGDYKQPVWTTTRMFASSRAYVMQPEDSVKYERWFDFRARRDGPVQTRMRDELAFGLGNRLELDLYNHTVYDGAEGERTFTNKGFSWEIRYALADWGKIPGNPTLYFEHKLFKDRQGIEPKLLLSDRIGNTDWIWAANLIYEANLGGKTAEEKEKEYAVTASIGKVINDNLMVGLSSHVRKYDYDTHLTEVYAGPAVNYKITNRARLSAEYMPRISSEGYYDSRSFLIFAYDFK
jgi:hypothetical protein